MSLMPVSAACCCHWMSLCAPRTTLLFPSTSDVPWRPVPAVSCVSASLPVSVSLLYDNSLLFCASPRCPGTHTPACLLPFPPLASRVFRVLCGIANADLPTSLTLRNPIGGICFQMTVVCFGSVFWICFPFSFSLLLAWFCIALESPSFFLWAGPCAASPWTPVPRAVSADPLAGRWAPCFRQTSVIWVVSSTSMPACRVSCHLPLHPVHYFPSITEMSRRGFCVTAAQEVWRLLWIKMLFFPVWIPLV